MSGKSAAEAGLASTHDRDGHLERTDGFAPACVGSDRQVLRRKSSASTEHSDEQSICSSVETAIARPETDSIIDDQVNARVTEETAESSRPGAVAASSTSLPMANSLSPFSERRRTPRYSKVASPSFEGFHVEPASSKRKRNATSIPPGWPRQTPATQRDPWEGSPFGDWQYQVHPPRIWCSLKPYRNLTVDGATFRPRSDVYVKPADNEPDLHPSAPVVGWIAKVLECCAFDETHAFVRVYWYYRPEDLPDGRQAYHGSNELIASNDMAIIDALTIDGIADVVHWQESHDANEGLDCDQLFWRQAYNRHTKGAQLSVLPVHCIDKMPFNPDDMLVQCKSCRKWLHAHCLEEREVRRAYIRHGLIRPKKSSEDVFSAHLEIHGNDRTVMKLTDCRGRSEVPLVLPYTCLVCRAEMDPGGNHKTPEGNEIDRSLAVEHVDANAGEDDLHAPGPSV